MHKSRVALGLLAVVWAVPASAQDWSGAYIGVFGGTASAERSFADNRANASSQPLDVSDALAADFLLSAHQLRSDDYFTSGGPFAGGVIGYDWQRGPWIAGIFADIAKSDIDAQLYSDIFGTQARYHMGVNFFGSTQLKLGYAFDRAQLYVHGGYAFAATDIDIYANSQRTIQRSNFLHGYSVGLGGEYALSRGLSLSAGYSFSALGPDALINGAVTDQFGTFPIRIDEEVSIHQLRFGINYRPGMASQVASEEAWTPSWSGFYVGAYAGLGASTLGYDYRGRPDVGPDTLSPAQSAVLQSIVGLSGGSDAPSTFAASGLAFGGQAGYDHQFGSIVAGAYVDFTRFGKEYDFNFLDSFSGAGDYIASLDHVGTVQGRIGYALDRALLYAHGGYAFGRRSFEFDFGGNTPDSSNSKNLHGFVVGAGAELALSENVSVVGDYSYTRFGQERIVDGRLGNYYHTIDEDAEFHHLRLGLNYRFGN